MKFSNYEHLKQWEGCKLTAYKDIGGVWTIGYGSTGPHVKPGMTITQVEANRLLDADLIRFEQAVNGVKVALNQNQYDALVSFAYNVGVGAFLGSTAYNRLNSGDYAGAAEALTWWNKVGGKVVQGLVNRREAEKKLFLTPVPFDTPTVREIQIKNLIVEFEGRLLEIVRRI